MHPHERDPGVPGDGAAKPLSIALWAAVILGAGYLIWGVLFPRIGPGENAARADAGTTVRNIVSALRSYESEYGHFPEILKSHPSGKQVFCFGDPECRISDGPNSLIFDVLRDIPRGPNADHALNPRQQKFFEMGTAKDPKKPRSGFADGRQFPEALQGCLFDPWGRQYCIVFTTDGAGKLDPSVIYADLTKPGDVIPKPVAAFSLGDDGVLGWKKYPERFREPTYTEAPNDIVSWQ